jgi:hypothetical protein
MPRPWTSVLDAIYPWLACLAGALLLAALVVCCGCHMPSPSPVHGSMVTAPLSQPDYYPAPAPAVFKAPVTSYVHSNDGSTPRFDTMCCGKYRPPTDGKPGLFVLVAGISWEYHPGDASPRWNAIAIVGVCFDGVTGEVFPPATVHVVAGEPATEPYAWDLCEVGLFYRYLPGLETENRMRVVSWDSTSFVLEMVW